MGLLAHQFAYLAGHGDFCWVIQWGRPRNRSGDQPAVTTSLIRLRPGSRKVFLVRVPMMYDRLIAVGTIGPPGPSAVIKAIEALG